MTPAAHDRPPIDLLEQIQLSLEGVDALLVDRSVCIEALRLQAQIDPVALREGLGILLDHLLTHSAPSDGVTIRVERADRTIVIELMTDDGLAPTAAGPDLTAVAEQLSADGATITVAAPGSRVFGWITVPRPAGGPSDPGA